MTLEEREACDLCRPSVTIRVDLGTRRAGTATITTSDLSAAYVRFNSAYST